MPTGTTGECRYYSESQNIWSTEGVETVITATAIECHTSHLTAFGAVGSSASVAVLSLLVVALAAFLQPILV
ncbi:transmembrane protein, putative [Bodo saltans]|uniref:Transmembrane protein, putative n=1 Tax=Bodo saltans TaxID=75058 RepID=A0A0S4J227_BODSA|nr:transmembrane protein, putative [Bodo saltans]|eukprot:CUG05713.1 transmembrane protein, putative [Bodo saltans]